MNAPQAIPSFQNLGAAELMMMLLGVVLFLILAVGLVVALAKNRSLTPLLPFFFVAIVMIGFPVIHSFTIKPDEVTVEIQELDKDIAAVQRNPRDPAARARLARSLQKTTSVAEAKGKASVAAESIALGNLQLGDAQGAARWAALAVKTKPASDSARKLLTEAQARQRLSEGKKMPPP